MNPTRMTIVAGLAFAVAVGSPGCAHQQLQPSEMVEVEAPSIARVQLRDIQRDIYSFLVYNITDRPIIVERDKIMLVGSSGERRHRIPGGMIAVYTVPAGGAQEVRVRFDQRGLGDRVHIDFSGALLNNGQSVAVPLVPVPSTRSFAKR